MVYRANNEYHWVWGWDMTRLAFGSCVAGRHDFVRNMLDFMQSKRFINEYDCTLSRDLRFTDGKAGVLEAMLAHDYVAWSQRRQADALAHVVEVCHHRFPAIGGLILWRGHDCWPCRVNTAVIDVEDNPKPAALAVAERFRWHLHLHDATPCPAN